MIHFTKEPQTHCFVGNPIVYEAEVSSDQLTVNVSLSNQSAQFSLCPYKVDKYEKYPAKVSIDVSDIIHALIGKELITIKQGNMIEEVSNFSFDCQITFGDRDSSQGNSIHIFRGGVSKWTRDSLRNFDLDMFSYRLNNPSRNILFTTRTNGHHLRLRESDLYPFVFIHPGSTISFITITGRIIAINQGYKDQIYSMDFATIRKTFAQLYNEIPSYIVVKVDSNYCFDVTFTSNRITENSFNLLFKNSLGGYESIEITGKGEYAPEFTEENTYQSLNDNNDFETYRERLFCKQIIEAETGYKTKEELNFIFDMVASDEIYRIEGNAIRRCHVTVDSPKTAFTITTPTSIPLKIELVNDDQFYTPEIDFSYPDNYPLVNITSQGAPELNGLGLIYGNETALHGE